MRMTFANKSLRARIVALDAAYAIAFAGLIASFLAAQAAAETATQPDVVICHSSLGEQPTPASQDSNGDLCIKSCIGCITSLAMAIPLTVAAAGPPQLSFKRLDLPARLVILAGAKANAHRSRGPPLAS